MKELTERLAKLPPAKRQLLQQRLRERPLVTEPIAIVGMGCRFPGAADLDAYWQLLASGGEAICEIPRSRWDIDQFYDPSGLERGKMSVRRGGFLEDVDRFDASFFGITPREANKIDPQQRLLLEVAWEALEHACWAPDRLAGARGGVFVGIGAVDYAKVPVQYENYYECIDAHGGTGNALSIAANRLSYLLDLRGPSMAIDTACSSSLVAVHLAVQSLRNGECDMALAGGVNMILTPETTIAFSHARMLSPDGHCRPFDAGANGYVRGEGCGVIVLKRLTDAVNDGDRILAAIRGTAVNQDGRTSGITAPNGRAQQDVIDTALRAAGMEHNQLSYIEAHGTGTPLGDPIEADALGRLFPRRSPEDGPCYVSSVKANIGHLETAAGIASVIKVLLMMQRSQIPRQLHFEQLNPHIALDGSRLELPRRTVDWQPAGGARVAGVSAFGFGGTNAHIIIEEGTAAQPVSRDERPQHILALSAKTPAALRQLASRYHKHLQDHPDAPLADICYSANVGRAKFNHRLAALGANSQELADALSAASREAPSPRLRLGEVRGANRPKLAFLFTGQGAQYAGMGRSLFETQPTFRQTLQQCDEILHNMLDHSLLSLLYPAPGEDSPLNETIYTQPCLFALEYALAALWKSWGIEPDVVLGHSVGEYVAACVAGVFSLEHGLQLIADRARLMQQLPKDGQMAVVFAPYERVEGALRELHEDVAIAAMNGPENTVISGKASAVAQLVADFEVQGIRAKRLEVSHAFHSPLVDPILDDFEQLASDIQYGAPAIPLISNLSGRALAESDLGARYWRDHIRQPVRFFEGMERLADYQPDAIVEIGPSAVLLGMGRRCAQQSPAAWLPSLRRGQDDWRTLLDSLARLSTLGVSVDWRGFDRDYSRRLTSVPTYPFERKHYWFDEPQSRRSGASGSSMRAGAGTTLHPLLGQRVPSCLEHELFENQFPGAAARYLDDHRVQGSVVMPAAAYLELGLAAAQQLFGDGRHALEDVSIQQAMFLSAETPRNVQVIGHPSIGGQRNYEVHSCPATEETVEQWTLHACGRIVPTANHQDEEIPAIELDAVRSRMHTVTSHGQFYELMKRRGLAYGTTFRVLRDLRRANHEALAELNVPAAIADQLSQYRLHPALLDACFQAMAGIIPLEKDGSYSPYTYMPVHVERLRLVAPITANVFVHAEAESPTDQANPETVTGHVTLVDADGSVLVQLKGVRVQRVSGRAGAQRPAVTDLLYRIGWTPQPAERPVATGSARDAVSRQGSSERTRYLIFADNEGVGQRLYAELLDQQRDAIVVTAGDEFCADDADRRLQIDPQRQEHYERLLQICSKQTVAGDARSGIDRWEVVHLWSLNQRNDDQILSDVMYQGGGSVLKLVQALARSQEFRTRQLLLVTCGSQGVRGDDCIRGVGQSSVWGLGRVAALEHPELHTKLIDVDGDAQPAELVDSLLTELRTEGDDNQVAYRKSIRYVARLEPLPALETSSDERHSATLGVPSRPYRLELDGTGDFTALRYRRFLPRRPEPGQVAISVRAAGLNFSDVLKAMGLYPGITDQVVPLGIEASGVVTAVGEGVERFRVGDEVLGVVPYSFASDAVTADYALVHKPSRIDDEEACTIPVTFLTAFHALCRLAQLQPGERVLIHAAAGGVGQAAIQIAQHLGAEIFATAGSDEKRGFVRGLGVEHVFNSRTLEFADQILEITERRGVDVVLNSLPGEAMTRSLSILAPYGRFLEIGKTDIYQNRMIGLLPFQDNLSYFAIDLDRVLRQRPRYIDQLFDEVMQHFAAGVYRPLPLTRFAAAATTAAFRYMAQRKNIGKVVVSLNEQLGGADSPSDSPVRAGASYLISGGLGALGLQVAEWLASQGAEHLILVSRRAPAGEIAARLDRLRDRGVSVETLACDVADYDCLRRAFDSLPENTPGVAGVVHCAGVLDDALLLETTAERFAGVLAAKAQGAWNLHRLTQNASVQFFLMFSSIASVLGSPGQSSYAAANATLDGLARYRRSRGLPALSINWGPWAGAGMAAEDQRGRQLGARGVELLAPETAFEVLDRLLLSEGGEVTVVDADWQRIRRQLPGRTSSFLQHLAASHDDAPSDAVPAPVAALRQQVLAVEPEGRQATMRRYLAEQLAGIMGIDSSELDIDQPLNAVGLDSLMALELKNRLESQCDFELPMAWFLEGPSVNSLAGNAVRLLEQTNGAAPRGEASSQEALGQPSSVWTPIVVLKEKGESAPLFCIHPLGGDTRCYEPLARALDADRPVYALRARGMDEDLPAHETMDEMINDYAAAIRRVRPDGPYHLAGWSTGGIYAFELARRLSEEGAQLGVLALVDAPLPSICQDVDLDDDARFLCDLLEFTNQFAGSQMKLDYEQLLNLSAEKRLEVALSQAKQQKVVPADLSARHIQRLIDVARANVRVLMNYEPGNLNHPLQMFRPVEQGLLEQRLGQDLDADLGWSSYVRGPVTICRVPGDHFSMMSGRGARELAMRLEERWASSLT